LSSRWKASILAAAVAACAFNGCRKSESPAAATPEARTAGATEQHPPFGFIDTPREGDTVASGSPATGWALDDSGVAKVEVSLDSGPAVRAELGQTIPRVPEANTTNPNSDRAGLRVAMPSAAAGPHLLVVTITARDGGKTDIKRHIQIR
jgi:hypothetical protein